MNLKKALTPKDTEEIKPGFFIQKTEKGYRQVQPIVWKDKWRYKEQLKTIFSLRTFLWIAIVLFLAWSYTHDVKAYQDFHTQFMEDPISICNNVTANYIQEVNPLGVINEDTNTLPSYP